LHAKTFAFDRRIGFIGSYNLDPRSSKLNTEMGVLFDCPELVKRLAEATGRDIDRYAYRVELVGNRLRWVSQRRQSACRRGHRAGVGRVHGLGSAPRRAGKN
jgi:putative cardiolipin synthase